MYIGEFKRIASVHEVEHLDIFRTKTHPHRWCVFLCVHSFACCSNIRWQNCLKDVWKFNFHSTFCPIWSKQIFHTYAHSTKTQCEIHFGIRLVSHWICTRRIAHKSIKINKTNKTLYSMVFKAHKNWKHLGIMHSLVVFCFVFGAVVFLPATTLSTRCSLRTRNVKCVWRIRRNSVKRDRTKKREPKSHNELKRKWEWKLYKMCNK